MKTLVFACAFALAAAATLPVAAAAAAADGAAPKRVAVLEFQGAIPPETLQVITDSARVGALDVASALGLVVMTRESMAAVLKDMGRPPGTCTEGECEVETGRLIGADVVVTGMVSRVEARYVVTVKTHETKGGALLRSEQVDTGDQFQLLASVKDATRRCLEPRDAGAAASVVYSTAEGKGAPATVTAAIDAAYEARRFAICSAVDTGAWTFCQGGQKPISENEFARRYRDTTGLADLDSSVRRWNWGSVAGSTGAFLATTALAALAAKKAHEANLDARGPADPVYTFATPDEIDAAKGRRDGWVAVAVLSSAAAIGSGAWALDEWLGGDGSPREHALSVPAGRGAVDRYNAALKEQLRRELGPTTEAPRRSDEPTVRIRPYLSPLGAGIAGVF